MKYIPFLLLVSTLFFLSCGGSNYNPRDLIIEDLPFHKVKDAKEYADLILKSIRTNRDNPILQEFELNKINVNERELNVMTSMYSSGIGGRDDWKFYDIYALSENKNLAEGFDYAWLDPTNRLGIQVYIETSHSNGQFFLEKIEFRSRLEIMRSISFPGGEIDDYKKIDYEWTDK